MNTDLKDKIDALGRSELVELRGYVDALLDAPKTHKITISVLVDEYSDREEQNKFEMCDGIAEKELRLAMVKNRLYNFKIVKEERGRKFLTDVGKFLHTYETTFAQD